MFLPKRGYLAPPAVIILALITLGVAIVLFFNRELILKTKKDQTAQQAAASSGPTSKLSPSPLSSPYETVNWKTYNNKKMGITLMYPSNYRVKENSTIDANGLAFDGVSFYILDPKTKNWGVPLDEGITLGVQDLKTTSFGTEIEHYYYQGGLGVPKTPNTKLDGVDASRWDKKHSGGSLPEGIAGLFAIKGNKSYLFALYTSYENEEVLIKNYNKILSTFKFLN